MSQRGQASPRTRDPLPEVLPTRDHRTGARISTFSAIDQRSEDSFEFAAPYWGGLLHLLLEFAGRYVTVWRKQADGQWKCVIDIWNSGPPTQ